MGKHEPWAARYTLDGSQGLEIQAGPLVDQSVKVLLEPGQSRHHVEFWIPSDRPRDIRALVAPDVRLVPPADIPRFEWAREREVALWREVLAASAEGKAAALPLPPDVDDNRWPPSGMDDLGEALQWAAGKDTRPAAASRWRFLLGAWLAGRDRVDEALRALEASDDDRAHVLAARLYRRSRGDFASAVRALGRIESRVFALHAQVVYERDLTLAAAGESTLRERRQWLDAVVHVEDEWLAERRAALLVDERRFEEARAVLEGTSFQFTHQRYARTRLWKRIRQALDMHEPDPPNWLGEDDLFEFGAYREYQEEA